MIKEMEPGKFIDHLGQERIAHLYTIWVLELMEVFFQEICFGMK